jgi:hypothetical protein
MTGRRHTAMHLTKFVFLDCQDDGADTALLARELGDQACFKEEEHQEISPKAKRGGKRHRQRVLLLPYTLLECCNCAENI